MQHKLTDRQAKTTKAGSYGDGAGLWLVVAPTGARKWTYRFTFDGVVKQMGLGSADVVGLARARDLRDEARKLVAAGVNPIVARRANNAPMKTVTFGEIADQWFDDKKGEFRNDKYRGMVKRALEVTAAPLRDLPVADVGIEDVLRTLKPVWVATPETGKRLREKIETILDAATAKGSRSGENPARWKGHLEHLLPRRQKVEVQHHAAMDYRDVPEFMVKLRADGNVAAKALEFTILCAARSGEVYGARWSEINLDANVWTLPAPRMKAGRIHRVPLSDRAVEILQEMLKISTSDFVFPGQRQGKPLSHVAMAKVLVRLGATRATPHGFRSAFRDWCGNESHFPREIAEAALAHAVGDSVEQAYRRSDALEKRRALMQAWANFCEPVGAGNVISIGGGRK
jgi:integrase